jgi:hypothetical protein
MKFSDTQLLSTIHPGRLCGDFLAAPAGNMQFLLAR